MLEKHSPLVISAVVAVLTGIAAAARFLMPESPGVKEATNAALIVTGVLLAIVSLVFLIVLILGALGFEIRR